MSFVKTFLKDVSNTARDRLWKLSPHKPGSAPDNLRIFSQPGKHVFFGYFDLSPFSSQGTLLLAHRTPFNGATQTSSAECEIGYFDLRSSEYLSIATTKAWCWQQGARLQFFDDESILFNRESQHSSDYESVVYSLASKEPTHSFSRALYCLSPDRKLGLSLNFSRLQRLRPGYGYSTFADETEAQFAPQNDGIWIGDLTKNDFRLLVSLQDLARLSPAPDFQDSEHYVNHLNFSPDGTKFIFFHLWKRSSQKYGRCFCYDLNTNRLKLIPTPGNPSHFAWKNSYELLLTYRDQQSKQVGYFLHSLETDKRLHFSSPDLRQDGHPTFINENSFVTDTYPGRTGLQELFYFDLSTNEKTRLGSFYRQSVFKGEFRIDLHPRLDSRNSLVAIDDEHKNFRAMKVLPLKI